MDKLHLSLNLSVPDNYAFVDPDAPLVLNLSQPIGYADRLTPSIVRGLNGKRLIDLNGVATKAFEEHMKKNGKKRVRGSKPSTQYIQEEKVEVKTQEKVEGLNHDETLTQSSETKEDSNTVIIEDDNSEGKYTSEYLNSLEYSELKKLAKQNEIDDKKKDIIIEKLLAFVK